MNSFSRASRSGSGAALALLLVPAVVGLGALGCKKDEAANGTNGQATSATGGAVSLNGAGATFPNPLYTRWISDYMAKTPNVKINYQSVGSGAGIKQISEETVDFGASDAPMTDEESAKAPRKLLHIPTTIGAVVLTYNIEGVSTGLKLSPDTLAGIFLGEIKTWDDAKIKADNPDAKLPSKPIGVAHRSDGSGTTAVFTEYLAKVSPEWKSKVGAGKNVNWPVGLGAKGNEGVTGQLKTTPNSIGYIELAFAAQNNLPVALLKNHAGKFVEATSDSISAAATAFADKVPDDLRMSIVDADGDGSYPISSFSYVLVYENTKDVNKGKALANFLWWGVHDGQASAPALHYAKLPAAIVTKDEAKLKSLTSGATVLLDTPKP